jgi:hypothetical protein
MSETKICERVTINQIPLNPHSNDIRFSPEYAVTGKLTEYKHNISSEAFIDANSTGGTPRVESPSDIYNIPEDIIRNAGYKVYVMQERAYYMLIDWNLRGSPSG